jgi:dTDP-4-amino-4,6-dideoxygalactose transaminase
MPEYDKYCLYIKELWESRNLTNNGKYLKSLENKLEDFLNIDDICLIQNGTLAIMAALKALNLEENSEIITTPFSFVATSSSIVWQGFKPVFIDIDPNSYNIDCKKIEEKITSKTSAILAVHVFGNPCDVGKIEQIARKYGLNVIYDAAHCFGVKYKGESILKWGDISTLSFHATKVFHTIEGGAIYTNNRELAGKIRNMINFGFSSNYEINDIGFNGKLNEFEAIMGILNLEKINEIIKRRREIYNLYIKRLQGLDLEFQKLGIDESEYNYSYFPLLFSTNGTREKVFEKLKENGINTRKYFYPLINEFSYYKKYNNDDTPVALNISERILTLPLYPELKDYEVEYIAEIIRKTINDKR